VAMEGPTEGQHYGGGFGRRSSIPDKIISFWGNRDSPNRSFWLGWARPVHIRHIALRAWVNSTQVCNGNRPNGGRGRNQASWGWCRQPH
jgi:hypothetical protein